MYLLEEGVDLNSPHPSKLLPYTVTGKNGPPKQNAVKCTIYNTI